MSGESSNGEDSCEATFPHTTVADSTALYTDEEKLTLHSSGISAFSQLDLNDDINKREVVGESTTVSFPDAPNPEQQLYYRMRDGTTRPRQTCVSSNEPPVSDREELRAAASSGSIAAATNQVSGAILQSGLGLPGDEILNRHNEHEPLSRTADSANPFSVSDLLQEPPPIPYKPRGCGGGGDVSDSILRELDLAQIDANAQSAQNVVDTVHDLVERLVRGGSHGSPTGTTGSGASTTSSSSSSRYSHTSSFISVTSATDHLLPTGHRDGDGHGDRLAHTVRGASAAATAAPTHNVNIATAISSHYIDRVSQTSDASGARPNQLHHERDGLGKIGRSRVRGSEGGPEYREDEIQLLKLYLDKEMCRRSHCEQVIAELHKYSVELQQQIAVYANSEHKKEVIIEQLDKALSKVVAKWGQHERLTSDTMKQQREDAMKFEKRAVTAEKHKQDLLNIIDEGKRKLVDVRAKFHAELEQAKRDRQKAYDHLKKDNGQLKDKMANIEAKFLELKKSEAKLKLEIDRKKTATKEKEQQCKNLESDKVRLETQATQLSGQLEGKVKRLECIEEACERRIEDLRSGHERVIAEYERKLIEQRNNRGFAEDKLKESEKEIENMKGHIILLIREHESEEAGIRQEAERVKQQSIDEVSKRHGEEMEVRQRQVEASEDRYYNTQGQLRDVTQKYNKLKTVAMLAADKLSTLGTLYSNELPSLVALLRNDGSGTDLVDNGNLPSTPDQQQSAQQQQFHQHDQTLHWHQGQQNSQPTHQQSSVRQGSATAAQAAYFYSQGPAIHKSDSSHSEASDPHAVPQSQNTVPAGVTDCPRNQMVYGRQHTPNQLGVIHELSRKYQEAVVEQRRVEVEMRKMGSVDASPCQDDLSLPPPPPAPPQGRLNRCHSDTSLHQPHVHSSPDSVSVTSDVEGRLNAGATAAVSGTREGRKRQLRCYLEKILATDTELAQPPTWEQQLQPPPVKDVPQGSARSRVGGGGGGDGVPKAKAGGTGERERRAAAGGGVGGGNSGGHKQTAAVSSKPAWRPIHH